MSGIDTAQNTGQNPDSRDVAEPGRRVRGPWIIGFSTAWLGIWIAQLGPLQVLLPTQVSLEAPGADWVATVMSFGIVAGIAGALTIVVYPVVGALSDRTRSRFGRRRPWIAAGTLVFAASLVFLGQQSTLAGMTVFWSLALIGFCMASSALSAVVSDQVPEHQRGTISAAVAVPVALGAVLALVLVGIVFVEQVEGYIAIAVAVIVLVTPFLVAMKDEPLSAGVGRDLRTASIRANFGINLGQHPDFTWALAARVLFYLGNALGTALLLYFFTFGVGADSPTDLLIEITLVYVLVTVVTSVVAGRMSDARDRRKVFVVAGGVLQAVAALALAVSPTVGAAFVAAVFLGLGWGSCMAVDQAIATGVLPDPERRGQHLGVMDIAVAVPQNVGPLIGALLVAATGGFVGLFVVSAIASLLAAISILRVKAVA